MTRPIRTVLFSTLFPSATRPVHGVFVETRLRELLSIGAVEAKVIAPVPWFPFKSAMWGDYAKFASTPAYEKRNGVEVWHPRYPLLPRVGMSTAPVLLAMAALPTFRRLMSSGYDFDLIDAHYFYPDGVAAAIVARQLRKPFVITARGTDLNLIPQHVLPRRMIQWAAEHAAASIGVCAALVDVLRGWGIPEERLHVMRNGVDLQRFRPVTPDEARQDLSLDARPVLLSVGHLVERKGHHLAIAAMPQVLKQHPRALLLIVGEGQEHGRLQALARQLGVEDHVRLTGAIPNDQLATWYSAADALILASSREGWANVLLEAMACGTPVVATRIWGTPEVVAEEEVGLLVGQRTQEALAAGICQLLASPRDRAYVRTYAERFGWAATSQAQLKLFSQVVRT